MLEYLTIRQVALIGETTIRFHGGMQVLTGETGAGKSIVVDSVNLILGGRADRELIRSGSEKASVEAVFNYLVLKFVETKIYSAVVESATCEHAARRMAMENATDNAREMLDDLNLNYNRARQSAITDEIIEIVAGSEAQH